MEAEQYLGGELIFHNSELEKEYKAKIDRVQVFLLKFKECFSPSNPFLPNFYSLIHLDLHNPVRYLHLTVINSANDATLAENSGILIHVLTKQSAIPSITNIHSKKILSNGDFPNFKFIPKTTRDIYTIFYYNSSFKLSKVGSHRSASTLIESRLDTRTYTMGLCFNGGKDACVTLDLLIENYTIDWIRTNCFIFIFSSDRLKDGPHLPLCDRLEAAEFQELIEFRTYMLFRYNLYLFEVLPDATIVYEQTQESTQFKWEQLLGFISRVFNFKHIFMGSRKIDFNNLSITNNSLNEVYTHPTTPPYPKGLVRVLPLYELTVFDIWRYIQLNNTPFCSLYCMGYTSIGFREKTTPNLKLLMTSPDTVFTDTVKDRFFTAKGDKVSPLTFNELKLYITINVYDNQCYLPAYFLLCTGTERNGRV